MAEEILGSVVWFLLFFVFIFIYPRLMLSQLIYQLEQSASKLEEMSKKSNRICAKKIAPKPSKELQDKIDEFTDFFVVEPSSLDPYGIVHKIDQTIRSMENRFTEFTDEIASGKSDKEKQEINYALRASIGVRQISKIVRHYVELTKKFKNLQIAMILKMQLPIIEKIAKGELKGTESFVNGWPIGDSIGPLVATSMMEKSRVIAEDVVMAEEKIEGRKCFILKATGPSPHLGRVDEAINKIMKRNKIARVITIDAAGKLEGEKTGTVAEGVGFAMGGIGQRELIENVLLPKKIPIDSVVVKVGMTEAIEPMKKDIYDAYPKTVEYVKKAVKRTKKTDKLIIIGIGNSCGVGNDKSAVESVKKVVEELHKKEEERKKKKGKKKNDEE
ncbi:MAG: DUF1512 family protein [Candidatus Aenigmarchaeota archaeon]|nr:DUF1512 family protein [Candidatus Aenigmarchaeota archaeon]